MSWPIIRGLLRVQLNTISSGFPTAFENSPFVPVVGTPWQWATLLPAQTEDPSYGDGFKREVGIFQVMLSFPKAEGPDNLQARGEILLQGFRRGTSLVQGNVAVKMIRSPYLGPPMPPDGVWYRVPVSVPFIADVQPA